MYVVLSLPLSIPAFSHTYTNYNPSLQPNGANLTGGGTGGAYANGSLPGQTSYVPFNGEASFKAPLGLWPTLALGAIGGLAGLGEVLGTV